MSFHDDLEQEIINDLAKSMAKSIDFDMLCDVLIPVGYTQIEITYGSSRKWFEVMEWTANICTGEYKEHNGKWLFEKEKDAIMFKLKWL